MSIFTGNCPNHLDRALRHLALGLGALSLLFGGSVMAATQLPFKDGGYLDARFVIGGELKGANEMKADLAPNRLSETPVQDITVIGKWWTLMGEFVANTGIVWNYRDRFTVKDPRTGKTYTLDQKMFSEYPALALRLKAARITFNKLEVEVRGVEKSAAKNCFPSCPPSKTVRFTIRSNDVIVPPAGESPYMAAPGSPKKWTEMVSIWVDKDRREPGEQSDDELRRLWNSLSGVDGYTIGGSATVRAHGLRMPVEELVAIAKLYEEYKKADKKLDNSYDVLKDGYRLPNAPAPYAGKGPLGKPYEEEIKSAEVFRSGKNIGLRTKSKITFESDRYSEGWPLKNSSKTFAFYSLDSNKYRLFKANGKQVSINDQSEFWRPEDGPRPGTYLLRSDQPHRVAHRTRDTYQAYSIDLMTKADLDRFIANDHVRSHHSGSGGGDGGLVLTMPKYHFTIYQGTVFTVDENMRVLSSEEFFWGADQND